MMKYYIFFNEDNQFRELLKDTVIKKAIKQKVSFQNYLIIGLEDETADTVSSYMMLKYGEEMRDFNKMIPDRSPKMHIDYTPKIDRSSHKKFLTINT